MDAPVRLESLVTKRAEDKTTTVLHCRRILEALSSEESSILGFAVNEGMIPEFPL